MTTTTMRTNLMVILAAVTAACTGAVEGTPATDPGVDLGVTSPGLSGDWDEARAAEVDPCEGAGVSACGDATRGACGVVSFADADQCIPLFNWGVTPDGTVQFGSQTRLFTIDALERAPLSAAEQDEGEARRQVLGQTSAEEVDPGAEREDDLEPLVGIDHSGLCQPYNWCYGGYYHIFVGHWNEKVAGTTNTYRHMHSTSAYRDVCWRDSSKYMGQSVRWCGSYQTNSW